MNEHPVLSGPALLPPRQRTMVEVLRGAADSPYGLVFVDGREREQRRSWREVWQRARRAAGALWRAGVRPSQRVAIVLRTSPAFVEAFFGAQLLGAVPVPLYPPVRLGRLEEYRLLLARLLEAVEPSALVTDRTLQLFVGPALEGRRAALILAHQLEGPELTSENPSPDELGLIQFSSGSTLGPKPVALTHRNLVSQCATLAQLLGQKPGSDGQAVGLSWLPLYHDMGLIGCLLTAAYYPGRLVLIAPEVFLARPAIWLRSISRYRATISPGPSFAFGLCTKRIADAELEGVELSSWQWAFNGAEPVSLSVAHRFAQRFARWGFAPQAMVPAYGLAEASLSVSVCPRRAEWAALSLDAAALARTGELRPGIQPIPSAGTPVPGMEIQLRPQRQAVGRIYVRGPSVMRGYFGQPPAADVRGWVDTGDLGVFRQGELYVLGRAKEVVIVRGANHSPQEFEECLQDLTGVRQGCAVAVGVMGPNNEEGLCLLVEKSPEATSELSSQVALRVAERTGIRPERVELLEPGTLPRTSSGKLRRQEALRRLLSGELAAPPKVSAARLAKSAAEGGWALAKRWLDELRG